MRMVQIQPQTALAALPAVAIDCETTGLDWRSARMVQLAAVALTEGRIDTEGAFNRLINPGIAIPAASSAIHGLTDESVAGAASFADRTQFAF
jgi:CBS domain-containing protein